MLLHRHLPADAVIVGMRAALAVGTPNSELVAVEARRAATAPTTASTTHDTTAGDALVDEHPGAVASLPERCQPATALPADRRPLPSVTPFDQLLRRRDARTDTASTSSDPPTPIAATSLRSPSRPPTTPRKPSDGHSHRPHDQRGVPTEQLSRRCPPRPGDPAALTSIDTACRELRLPSIRSRVEDMIAAAEREQLGYARFLAEALLAECDDRDERRRTRRVHDAAFPRTKRLEDFDHTANGRRSMLGPAPRTPGSLNAWITSRAYCAVAANIAAASLALRPCIEASTIPARAQPYPILPPPGDLDQALRLGRSQLPDEEHL